MYLKGGLCSKHVHVYFINIIVCRGIKHVIDFLVGVMMLVIPLFSLAKKLSKTRVLGELLPLRRHVMI